MNKSRTLFLLFTSYLLLSMGSLGVAAKAWTSSSPNISLAAVKGASTESSTASTSGISLSAYPTFDSELADPIYAKQYALYHVESGKVLMQSKTIEPVSIASTTKIMTSLLAIKHGKMDDIVTVSQAAASQPFDSSLMGLHPGEKISVENLIYGAMLVSGNDAAQALAEYVGSKLNNDQGTSADHEARFVKEMNDQAANYRMGSTHYADSVGYDDDGTSTAIDLAKLTSKAIADPTMAKIIGTPLITVYSENGYYRYDLRNSNRLVADYQYPGSIGGKTGFTNAAGHCLISAAKRDGSTFVAVILNTISETNEASAVEARKLLENGFRLTRWN